MSRIISYGEDPLTFWAITSQLSRILQALGDQSSSDRAIVVYRPSFGRRGRTGLGAEKGQLSAEFGEFDAILGTQSAIYLVESKWHSSSEARSEWIELRPGQIHRHEILHWYFEKWQAGPSHDWDTFISRHDKAFRSRFLGNKLAPVGSTLAKNLEFVLGELNQCGSDIQDVLLFIGQTGGPKPMGVRPDSFRLVAIDYQPLTPTGYFQMA